MEAESVRGAGVVRGGRRWWAAATGVEVRWRGGSSVRTRERVASEREWTEGTRGGVGV